MRIIDKASWQIDGGLDPIIVVEHFKRVFQWLADKKFLTAEGKEVVKIGIDQSVSLHERLVTPEGLAFLAKSYDIYLKNNPYGSDKDSSALEKYYMSYQLM